MHKKDVGIAAFDLIGLPPTSHIIAYTKNGIYQSLLGNVQIDFNFIVGKSTLQEMANFSNYLEDFRP